MASTSYKWSTLILRNLGHHLINGFNHLKKKVYGILGQRDDFFTMNLSTGRPKPYSPTFITAIALVSLMLFSGCSKDEITDAPVMSHDSEAQLKASSMSTSSNGLIIQNFPSPDNPGPPLYASGLSLGLTGFGATRTDGEYVAITLVRDPDCIPPDYNLLGAPNIPAVFGCELTIKGKVWLRDPTDISNPVKAMHFGLGAVPVYFVSLSDFEEAVEDFQLTIDELHELESLLIGHASYQRDVIQFQQNGRPGMHSIVSRGQLEDGRSFEHIGVVVGDRNVHTTIRFE
ncbi:hypothetical protein [Gramella sp. KN1008]|uniref:hypothetical protein n=1 Tax=Gramella sp. KN1008 TaxID=2529298 RepID=UPI0010388893|nr:hypothetical protein [Gramella sp. KN1008]TBW29967.1 hypothetical protein EZJ28_00755 [Gramella sp. KN1008]